MKLMEGFHVSLGASSNLQELGRPILLKAGVLQNAGPPWLSWMPSAFLDWVWGGAETAQGRGRTAGATQQ